MIAGDGACAATASSSVVVPGGRGSVGGNRGRGPMVRRNEGPSDAITFAGPCPGIV